jgi:hypothetical protein
VLAKRCRWFSRACSTRARTASDRSPIRSLVSLLYQLAPSPVGVHPRHPDVDIDAGDSFVIPPGSG